MLVLPYFKLIVRMRIIGSGQKTELSLLILHSRCFTCANDSGLWRTRQTEDTKVDRELHIRTTLRELIIYVIFLIVLCIRKYKR